MEGIMRGSQCIMNLGVNSLCSNLGYVEDGYYIPSDDCEDILAEFLRNLQEENPVQRAYRRQLCFSRVVEMDIIPLIKFVKDQPNIFSSGIRFLTSLIQPVECLTKGMPSDLALPWLSDVNRMLICTRRLCQDKQLISAITTEIKIVLDDHDGQPMEEETCDFINKCLLLFRNLLYIQDVDDHFNQGILVLYLLECNLGEVLNKLVKIPQREYWCASIIQLVSLMYTRQTLELLKPSLNLESSSEELSGSDDMEEDYIHSSTCPVDDDTDTMNMSLTGLFKWTLHVKEDINGDQRIKYRDKGIKCDQDMETIVDDEDEKKEVEHFRYLLLRFTHDFIEECFGFLMHDLKNVLISDMKDFLDDTYFLWAMAFFLKIARTENLPFKVVRLVLTTELFGFLAYEGVILTEQLLIAQKRKNDSTYNGRRLHLTITAINEILKTLYKYSIDENLDDYDKEYLVGLQKDLANITDLRMVFILLIRHFQSKDTSMCFLEDLITTNHTFLELMDRWDKKGWVVNNFNMLEHIKLYATRSIMQYYGTLLENFETNSVHVNQCVFTMMHHIAGDCGKPDTLMQMHIIQALMEVDGTKNHMTKEMNDLTEYLLNRFENMVKNSPYMAALEMYGISDVDTEESSESGESETKSEDSGELDDMLFSMYTELQREENMVYKMMERFADLGISVTAQEVWSRLYASGLITNTEYLANKNLSTFDGNLVEQLANSNEKDVVSWCVQALKEKHQEENLKWLQTLLCETAYVKLGKQCDRNLLEEPVIMFHVLQGSSVPIILYKEEQEAFLNDQHFNILLHYLGFHTPQDVGMVFPRIPSFWTSEQLIKQAEKLGPLSNDILKFDPTSVKYEDEHSCFPPRKQEVKNIDLTEIINEQPVNTIGEHNVFWLKQIQQYNRTQQVN